MVPLRTFQSVYVTLLRLLRKALLNVIRELTNHIKPLATKMPGIWNLS